MRKTSIHTIGSDWGGSFAGLWGGLLLDPSLSLYQRARQAMGPHAPIVVRWFDPHQLLDDPRLRAEQWFARHYHDIVAMRSPTTVFQGYNEIADGNAAAYVVFEMRRLELLHSIGANIGMLAASVGTPDYPVWNTYAPLLARRRPGDVVILHEYWPDRSGMANTHWVGRWRLVPQLKDVPIYVGECGRDVIHEGDRSYGQAGWRRTTDAAGFMVELREYDALLCQFPQVQGAAVFQDGSSDPQWHPFALNEVVGLIALETVGVPQPTPEPAQPTQPPPAQGGENMSEFVQIARSHKIRINPGAALWKAIRAASQAPGSHEWYDQGRAFQWGYHEATGMWHLWEWSGDKGARAIYKEPVVT